MYIQKEDINKHINVLSTVIPSVMSRGKLIFEPSMRNIQEYLETKFREENTDENLGMSIITQSGFLTSLPSIYVTSLFIKDIIFLNADSPTYHSDCFKSLCSILKSYSAAARVDDNFVSKVEKLIVKEFASYFYKEIGENNIKPIYMSSVCDQEYVNEFKIMLHSMSESHLHLATCGEISINILNNYVKEITNVLVDDDSLNLDIFAAACNTILICSSYPYKNEDIITYIIRISKALFIVLEATVGSRANSIMERRFENTLKAIHNIINDMESSSEEFTREAKDHQEIMGFSTEEMLDRLPHLLIKKSLESLIPPLEDLVSEKGWN